MRDYNTHDAERQRQIEYGRAEIARERQSADPLEAQRERSRVANKRNKQRQQAQAQPPSNPFAVRGVER